MLISVIIPYFKKEKYIFSSVKSVLNQSYKKIELILVDDELSEFSFKLLNKIKLMDKRIKIIRNKKNYGAGISRNHGIKVSKGEYIAFLDADDLWKKNKLSEQYFFMRKNSSKICHTSYLILKNKKPHKIRKAKKQNYKNLRFSCDIGLSTVMIKKELIRFMKFPNLRTKEDYALWLKITRKGITIDALEKVLVSWNDVDNSLSSSVLQKIKDGYLVYRKYMKLGLISSIYHLSLLSLNYLKKS